jgi:hypothetical protein
MEVWTVVRAADELLRLLQQKVQFVGEQNMQAGDITKPTWNGLTIRVYPDILDSDWFMINGRT